MKRLANRCNSGFMSSSCTLMTRRNVLQGEAAAHSLVRYLIRTHVTPPSGLELVRAQHHGARPKNRVEDAKGGEGHTEYFCSSRVTIRTLELPANAVLTSSIRRPVRLWLLRTSNICQCSLRSTLTGSQKTWFPEGTGRRLAWNQQVMAPAGA